MDTFANSTTPIRRVLRPDELHRIHTMIHDAADTRQLLVLALGVLYDALLATPGSGPTAQPIVPDRYALPSSQWQAILTAMTRRAEAWGTAAEIGLALATGLLPGQYDDPSVPAPDLRLPDYRPAEFRITLTRDAIDVITNCEAHLDQLHRYYGPISEVYQTALHSWHRNLTVLLTINAGSDLRLSGDGPLSLFVRASSGLTCGLIFHQVTRRCTIDGCDALIADDGAARPPHTGAAVGDHQHIPSYPLAAARPGTWSLHS
ncbi:MAG: hypothetical protein JXA67_02845 [Micromonosporaceae bacterium]|nr:hypothetical protein [Micromonosporaceae bacterium]